MLKIVVTYIDSDKFDAVRRELAESGISHMAAIAAGSATPDPFSGLSYRGSAHMATLSEKTRLEFVVRAEGLTRIKEAILRTAGPATFMFIVSADEVLPEADANPGAIDAA